MSSNELPPDYYNAVSDFLRDKLGDDIADNFKKNTEIDKKSEPADVISINKKDDNK